MSVKVTSLPPTSLDNQAMQIVAVHQEPCPKDGRKHVTHVKLADDSELTSSKVMILMDVGKRFFMIPPPGAPAYEAYRATGLPLLVQTRTCSQCGERVLFA